MIALKKEINKDLSTSILYRVAEINKDKDGNHLCLIQIIGKGLTFKIKPEDLLSNDERIDYFSQKDIRTLTYLGYANVNSPKYKVLAKKHSDNKNKMIFALHKKGEKKPVIKTADEISIDDEILDSLSKKDAHMVGYITATEQTLLEAEEKKKLKAEMLSAKNNNKIPQ